MAIFEFKNIKIAGIASAVPTKVVKTDDYRDVFGKESIEKFKRLSGVEELRHTSKYQTASDLGYVAARKIIDSKQIDVKEIGAVVYGGHSHDYIRPATACVLQHRLGLPKDCIAFDVGLGCSSFIYGVQIVASIMNNSNISKAILIVGETNSKVVNPRDRSTTMLLGDAASAILLEKTEEDTSIKSLLYSNGSYYQAIMIPAGGFRNLEATREEFACADDNYRSLYNINMNGVAVFTFAITEVVKSVKEFLSITNTSVTDYDCFAFHQANRYISEQIVKRVKIPQEKMLINIGKYGNTSGSAIPLVLSDYYGEDETGAKDVLMCGFGVGLSWGVCSARIDMKDVYGVVETDDVYMEGFIENPSELDI